MSRLRPLGTVSPLVIVRPSAGSPSESEKALDVMLWQPVQWQAIASKGGLVTLSRTAPQRQPPSQGSFQSSMLRSSFSVELPNRSAVIGVRARTRQGQGLSRFRPRREHGAGGAGGMAGERGEPQGRLEGGRAEREHRPCLGAADRRAAADEESRAQRRGLCAYAQGGRLCRAA